MLASIGQLLRAQSTVVLSTVADDGLPHATPLFYLTGEKMEVYWFSSESALHSLNLARDNRAGAAIYAPTHIWNEIRGVQLRGNVERISDRILRREVTHDYCERFCLGTTFRLTLSQSSLYVFRPSWVRYLDNSRRFGFKCEIDLRKFSEQD